MKKVVGIVGAAAAMCVSCSAYGQVGDFYLADADGGIYSVNGQTLEATLVHTLVEDGLGVNEIMYMGNDQLLVNVTGGILSLDLSTGNEEIVFRVNDYMPPEYGISYNMGLARAGDTSVYFSVIGYPFEGADYFSATYDFASGDFAMLPEITPAVGLYFDHQNVGDGRYLAADFAGDRLLTINSVTGATEEVFDVGFGVVSMLESRGDLYLMDRFGSLFSFDQLSGETSLYGGITGFTGNVIGASINTFYGEIPTPGVLSLLGLATLSAARRRRR